VYKPPVEDSLPPPKRARVDEAESEAGKKICNKADRIRIRMRSLPGKRINGNPNNIIDL
jgi:hypothetical protein